MATKTKKAARKTRRAKATTPTTPKWVYGIRSVRDDMMSRSDFRWPASGWVECPDWKLVAECGHGLHFLRPGDNAPGEWYDGPIMVVRADASDVVELNGKCKARRVEVVHVGDIASATTYMAEHATAEGLYRRTQVSDRPVRWMGGDGSTLTGGYGSTLTGGDDSTLMLCWFDGVRRRVAVAYVGEDGIEPGVAYRVDDKGKFVRA